VKTEVGFSLIAESGLVSQHDASSEGLQAETSSETEVGIETGMANSGL
jgi:hypothetical protein